MLYRFIHRHREYEFVRETISALEFFFTKMGHQEKPIYLYHALLLLIRRNEIDWGSTDQGIDTPMVDVEKLYQDHIAGGKMQMDGYILDLHTHGGKRSVDCLEKFALEGAYIENENVNFLRREYRDIYVLLKQKLDRYRCSGGRLQQMSTDDLKTLAHKVGVPIKNLSAHTMTSIFNAPQGQKKRGEHKKPFKIVDDLVFKGPYSHDESQLMNNLKYTYAIQIMETVLQMPEWQRGTLKWEYIGCWKNDQYFFVMPNVGKKENIPFELVNTELEKNVKVVLSGGHVRLVSEIEKTDLLTDNIKMASLQHLYFRFLLGIGDSGTHNILIREDHDRTGRLIAGIDLEERRGNSAKRCRLDHLFKTKRASKDKERIYSSDIKRIKLLSYDQLNQDIIDSLDAVGIDLERLKANIELWDSYSHSD